MKARELLLAAIHPRLPIEGELPSLGSATEWLNSQPLTAASLRGKVVLIDFWTYTCINWLRQLPYLRAWAEKYKDQGLVVVGVHTPEFAFERDVDNVRRAAKDMRVDYPVAIDNDYAIWRAFNNSYWPALYFVDAQGHIRHHQFGEGAYEESEMILQRLLEEAPIGGSIGHDLVSVDARGAEAAADWGSLRSPENYLGYERTENFASPGGALLDERRVYAAPARLRLNHWASRATGRWRNRLLCSTRPTGRSPTAFTPAIFISSWDRRREGLPCDFACSSMDGYRALLTGSTLTSRATARLANSGCIS
jgi:thiol-disulfide isomerase/thioredoxin